jgi:4-amino-4-deoxy-L-arabinose transferase-like glycosyltransferase
MWRRGECAKLKRILFLLVVAAALARVYGIDRPWSYGDHDGWGGAFYSNIARNYVRYGYLATELAPVTSTGDTPKEEWRYYLTHPPFIGLAVSSSFHLFGEHEWSARIVPLVFSLANILLVFRLAGSLWPRKTALVAAALLGFVPMEVFYATHVDPQGPPVTFAALALLLAYREGRPLLAAAAFVLGAGFDWPIHYMAGLIAVHALVIERGKKRWAVLLPAGSIVLVLGFLTYAHRVAPDPEQHYIQSSATDSFLFWTGLKVTRGHIPGHRMARPGAGEWLAREWGYFEELYGAPLLLLAIVGVVAAGGARERSYLALVLLWGAAHIAIFPMGAFVHDYWMTYLAPGLALAAARALVFLTERLTTRLAPKHASRVATAALVGAVVTLGATWVARSVGRIETSRDDPALFGMKLHELAAPDEGILSLSPFDARDAYYADRRIRDGVNSVALFQESLGGSTRYRYFVAPRYIYEARPHKPLFESLTSCCTRLSFEGYYVFDLQGLQGLQGLKGPSPLENTSISPAR